MDRLGRVNEEIAVRFAATVFDDVTPDKAAAIVREFLEQLSRCGVCDNTGMFTFLRDVQVYPTNDRGEQKPMVVPGGTVGPCPRCGFFENNGDGRDPAWVKWFCEFDDRERCGPTTGKKGEHEECGWRIVLPTDFMKDRSPS
jgi:hypothetical protein